MTRGTRLTGTPDIGEVTGDRTGITRTLTGIIIRLITPEDGEAQDGVPTDTATPGRDDTRDILPRGITGW